jgi:hypothetical protein
LLIQAWQAGFQKQGNNLQELLEKGGR